jgi:hypothetical protein
MVTSPLSRWKGTELLLETFQAYPHQKSKLVFLLNPRCRLDQLAAWGTKAQEASGAIVDGILGCYMQAKCHQLEDSCSYSSAHLKMHKANHNISDLPLFFPAGRHACVLSNALSLTSIEPVL